MIRTTVMASIMLYGHGGCRAMPVKLSREWRILCADVGQSADGDPEARAMSVGMDTEWSVFPGDEAAMSTPELAYWMKREDGWIAVPDGRLLDRIEDAAGCGDLCYLTSRPGRSA